MEELRLIVGHSTFQLRGDLDTHGDEIAPERFYSVILDGELRGRISILAVESPSVAVHLPFIFIWGGSTLFGLDTTTGLLTGCIEHDDEVLSIYPLGTSWCLVGETSIAIVDSRFASKRELHHFDEIVLESWWSAGKLHLRDLQGRVTSFAPQLGLGEE
jgi:hypothetical protein